MYKHLFMIRHIPVIRLILSLPAFEGVESDSISVSLDSDDGEAAETESLDCAGAGEATETVSSFAGSGSLSGASEPLSEINQCSHVIIQ